MATATTGGEVIVGRSGGHKRLLGGGFLLLALALIPVLGSVGGGLERGAPAPSAVPSERDILQAPVGFVENVGQAHSSATHVAQGPGYAFAFGREGVRVSLGRSLSLGLEFVGANPDTEAVLAGRPTGRADYLVGERSRWRTGLATYPEVVYRDLWPGVDMAFTGSKGTLKYEFRLAPGADPSRIQLAYQGAQSLSVGSAGALNVHTGSGVLRDAAPVSYQRIDGRRAPVESSFALGQGQGHGYGFTVGAYDHSQPLVIDPGLEYSTYLGGSGNDSGFRIEARGRDAFVTGGTGSVDFPVTPDAYDTSFNGGAPPTVSDAFVSRVDTRKSGAASLEYSTFLGGSGNDFGVGIDVRGQKAYVTGQTDSANFPVTADAYQPSNAGAQDAFVVRLDTTSPGAAGLEYSSFLGGTSNDRGFEIEVRGDDASITGIVASADFPVTANAYDQSFNGLLDVLVARIDTAKAGAAGLEYSSFLGGSGQDGGRGLAVKANDVYLTGPVGSADFPVTANAYDQDYNGGATDAFVTRLDTRRGTAGLEFSSYFGSSGDDEGFSLAAKGHDAFLSGVAGAANFPVSANAFDSTFAGGAPCAPPPSPFATCDAFVSRIDTRRGGAAALEYSTFLGGAGGEIARDIALRGNDAFVTGVTASADFPTANAYDASFNGVQDAFVTQLDTTTGGAAGLEYSTFLGGSSADEGFGIALNRSDVFIAGPTGSADFPTTPGAFDQTFGGGGGFVPTDAFVSRLDTGSGGGGE